MNMQQEAQITGKRGYRNLREHLAELEKAGMLLRVQREVQKETDIHTLVRWQFVGGIPEEERKAFLFENVTDAKGKKYAHSVAVAALAANPQMYAIGMGCSLEEIEDKWKHAMDHLIPPVEVSSEEAPVHEVVLTGQELDREGFGFDQFPIPISTPGFDVAPFTTCSHWFTHDPETGIRNVGNYRGQIKGRTKVGAYPAAGQHMYIHWSKAQKKGEPLQAALVIGSPPVVSYAAVQKVPYGVDEIEVAGGLAGEPIRMVKCKTIDVMVPADAEIVFEGIISTEYLEPEGAFGESHGYMHPREWNPYMNLTAVTHRNEAIWVSFISQVTPSESSVIKKVGYNPLFTRHLKDELNIQSVIRVHMHEPLTNLRKFIIIQFKKPKGSDVSRALHAAAVFHKGVGKIIVAVDEDIDPENTDAVMWAMCYRMKPHKDVQFVTGMEKWHAPPFTEGSESVDSVMLVDATLKEPFPPISLPKKEYMEKAKVIWEELGLPKLKPQSPWFGYSLGDWSDEADEEALAAIQGEHYKTGEKLEKMRKKV